MKILIKDNLVDFEAPIYACEEYRKKVMGFFKENFSDMGFKEVSEPKRTYKDKVTKKQHKWTAKDYLKLFSTESNEEIAEEIGLQTAMGPQVKRGTFIMNFLKWKKEKGIKLPLTQELIQKYLEEVDHS